MQPDLAAAILEAETEELEVSRGFVLQGIPWIVYRTLRALDGPRNVRMSYLDGTLYLMSPEYIHERGGSDLATLVLEVAQTFSLDFEHARSTTLRRKTRGSRRGSGKEADASFYVGTHAEMVRGKDNIRLSVDPPPDLAIEVDNKADSSVALPIYARLRVPEVWRYWPRRKTLWFGMYNGRDYDSIERSLVLPMLTPQLVLQALELRDVGKVSLVRWKSWLSEWARSLPAPPPAS
jgi:Uma2 family endonuclease